MTNDEHIYACEKQVGTKSIKCVTYTGGKKLTH